MYKFASFQMLQIAIATVVALSASHLVAAQPTTAYSDNFSSVKGHQVTHTNGVLNEPDEPGTRVTFTFMSESIVGGKLTLTSLEDAVTTGPDKKPGVLSLAYSKLPISADYSGFVYAGRTDEPIALSDFKGTLDEATLRRVTVAFRYKATNANQAHAGAAYNFRFETDVDNPYEHRIDFGSLEATGEWQTFEKTLSQGINKSAFMNAVNASPEAALKLVWGQDGDITSYDEGDTLLIDDIEIRIAK